MIRTLVDFALNNKYQQMSRHGGIGTRYLQVVTELSYLAGSGLSNVDMVNVGSGYGSRLILRQGGTRQH